MDTVKEYKKIVAILEGKRFQYKGGVYSLDVEATNNCPTNPPLQGKPLMKIIGSDGSGNTVMVWSHDCEPLETSFELSASDLDQPAKTVDVYVFEVQPKSKKTEKSKKKH